ncbi:MAG: nucleotidyltransferase family protein [Bacteroidaceae bacterium]|nr:nucleotidyltransferase family protein [Bacteroidaceae bacterium]
MKQAMILAAGLGTRLKPLTDRMPKALVKVGGQPLLWHVVMKLRAAGYERVVVNVHHFAQQIVDYLAANDNFGIDIRISDETEQLLETGGALKKAQALFDPDEPVLIHNVDILDNVDFDWLRRRHLDDEDAVLLVSRRTTQRYLMFDNAMRLMGWKNTATGEVKSPYEYVRRTGLSQHGEPLNAFAFSGIHSLSPRLFPLMERFPDRFSIMDFYLSVCHRSRVVGLLKDDLRILDVGKLDTLDQANEFIKQL